MEAIQLSLFGKTCPEHSAATKEKISEPCWKSLPGWKNQRLQFLDLRGANGSKPERSSAVGGAWLGDSSMLNIGEFPSVVSASLLSQILEVNAPQKYYLSARACQGILTRASRRGKALPDLLKTALLDMIEWWQGGRNAAYTLKIRSGCAGGGKGALVQTKKTGTLSTLQDQTLFQPVPIPNDQGGGMMSVSYDVTGTLRVEEYGHQPIVFDARGNGGGQIVPTITGDHESRITDYTAVTVEQKIRWIVRRLTPTECERLQGFPEIMEANIMEMTKDEYIAFNLATGQIIADCENGKVYTTKGPGGNILKEPKELSGTIIKGYRVVSIRNGDVKKQCRVHRIIWIAKNGIVQDGLVVDHINNDKLDNRISNLQLLTAKENSTKASKDDLYRSGNESPATILPEEKRIEVVLLYQTGEFTMHQLAEKYGISKSRVHQIVKAYGWTDIGEWVDSKGKKHKPADTPRYKALGNSIALPQWWWIVNRMRSYLRKTPTLGSLFDGIGGFPLVWETAYGKGTARWASEIEDFCIAVTKRRFSEEGGTQNAR